MTEIGSLMDMAKEALLAHQASLYVTGHNIANASTPGYSRQRVLLKTEEPVQSEVGPLGRGVRAVGVERLYDRFISAQLTLEKQQLGKWCASEDVNLRVEQMLGLFSSETPGPALSDFFNAFEDLAGNPTGTTERQAVAAAGERLAFSFQTAYSRLTRLRRDINSEIAQVVNDVNALAGQISELNTKINAMETGYGAANDLRDRRDMLIDELAEMIGFTYFSDNDGLVNIALESGHMVVEKNLVGTLGLKEDAGNGGLYDVLYVDDNGNEYTITESISRGRLGGLLGARDSQLVSYISDIDKLARSVIEEVNVLHTQGRGLVDFTTLTSANTVDDPGADLDVAGLPFTPVAGSFDLVVTDGLGGSSITNITILDGITDSLNDLAAAIDGVADLNATVVGGALEITADPGYTFYFANDTSDILKALGLNVFFAGGGSSDIALASSIEADDANICAGLGGGPGDNSNALAIAQLRDSPVIDGSSTLNDFYNALIGRTGVDGKSAAGSRGEAEAIVNQLAMAKAAASGVSIDEELAHLLMVQRAFQAAARLISISDELLEELIGLVS